MRRTVLLFLACATSLQAQWRLERVASTADDVDITWIGSFTASRPGEILATDGKAQHIVVYDSTGRRVRTIGRKGAGPLEFRALMGLAWLSDTLVAYDRLNGITFVAPNGKLIRTVKWPARERPSIWLGSGGSSLIVVAYGNGRTVPIPGINGTQNIRPPKTFFDVRDTTVRLLSWVSDTTADPYGWSCWNDPAGMVYGLDDLPGGNGPFNAVTTRGEFVFLSPDRTRIFSQTSEQRPRLRKEYPPLPVTDAVWNREAAEYVEIEKKAGKLSCSKPFTRPAALPPVRGIAADDAGGVWAEVNTPEGSRYDVYDPDGRLAGSVTAPKRRVQHLPFVVRGGKLYVAEKDADDVISITVYRLRR